MDFFAYYIEVSEVLYISNRLYYFNVSKFDMGSNCKKRQ